MWLKLNDPQPLISVVSLIYVFYSIMSRIRTKFILNRYTDKSEFQLRDFLLKKHLSIITGIITIWCLNTPAVAGDFQFRGPLQVRNQFPATLPFLSFSPDHAPIGISGEWTISVQYSHANTYARSGGILHQLPQSKTRLTFNPSEFQSDKSESQYYIDSGSGRMAMNITYNVSNVFSVSLEIPLIGYYGGFLDTPIENFHKLAGYAFQSRAMMSANQTHFYLSATNDIYINQEQLRSPGIGDIVLKAKRLIIEEDNNLPGLAFRVAAKFPTGEVSSLKGSGSFDFGANVILSKQIGYGYATTNLGVVIPGKWQLRPELRTRPAYSWSLVYEHPFWKSVSLIIQNQIMSSVLSSEINADIAKTSYEWTVGSKIDLSKSVRLSVGVTENYIHHQNAPDFGLHAGLEWRL